jgi:hypothetical protein
MDTPEDHQAQHQYLFYLMTEIMLCWGLQAYTYISPQGTSILAPGRVDTVLPTQEAHDACHACDQRVAAGRGGTSCD